jgi:PIN domain nuclease of toxin-antitoxin system
MTRLLLDTQVLLWWKEGSRKLGQRARREIETHAAPIHVSAVTAWEIAIKSQLGRLTLAAPLHSWMPGGLEREGFEMLSVTVEHAVAVASLPAHHPDPFDRLLIAQAQIEDLTIVTSDTAFDEYGVRVLDARR